jgi:hypothetical protein
MGSLLLQSWLGDGGRWSESDLLVAVVEYGVEVGKQTITEDPCSISKRLFIYNTTRAGVRPGPDFESLSFHEEFVAANCERDGRDSWIARESKEARIILRLFGALDPCVDFLDGGFGTDNVLGSLFKIQLECRMTI